MHPDLGSFIKRASFNGTSALWRTEDCPRLPFDFFRVLKRYHGMGTYEAAFTLSLAGTPPRSFPAPLSSISAATLHSPWPSALQVLNSSHSVSSRSSTVTPLRSISTLTSDPHGSLATSLLVPVSRSVCCLVRRVRQGPMPQAKANGGWEPPPDHGLVNSLHPHNLGSFLAYIATPLGPLFTPPPCHSMKSSMPFAFTLPTRGASQAAMRICTSPTLPRCSVS